MPRLRASNVTTRKSSKARADLPKKIGHRRAAGNP
jgi:hypothetical protein